MSERLSNHSLAAEPVVPSRTPVHGQASSLSHPVRIGGCYCHFQAQEEDPVLRGSGFAHPSTSSEPVDRELG